MSVLSTKYVDKNRVSDCGCSKSATAGGWNWKLVGVLLVTLCLRFLEVVTESRSEFSFRRTVIEFLDEVLRVAGPVRVRTDQHYASPWLQNKSYVLSAENDS